MLNTILGTKKNMQQTFLADRTRVPVTKIQAGPCLITQIKEEKKDGYNAVQLGFGRTKIKRISKPRGGHLSQAGWPDEPGVVPQILREVRVDEEVHKAANVGKLITADQVLSAGDLVNVIGLSRGKGFTGVVKRWGFKGGPKTHGQSDRARAPGSIGQTTTPGRVYKGKKMAGRSGNQQVTIRNLLVLKVLPDGEVWIKGQVPGAVRGVVTITKIGNLKFVGLHEESPESTKQEPTQSAESVGNNEKRKVRGET